MGWLLCIPFPYPNPSSCGHGESVSSVAVVSPDWETCYVWRELLDSQLLSPGCIHCAESRKFLCFRWTLDGGRVHTTGLLSTLPAQRVPSQVFITLLKTYFRGILFFWVYIKVHYYVLLGCGLECHVETSPSFEQINPNKTQVLLLFLVKWKAQYYIMLWM